MTDTLISGGCGCDGGTIHSIREHTKKAKDLKEYTKGFGKRVSKMGFNIPAEADLKSIKKTLPDGRVQGFKADAGAQREALIRIGKAVNKMSGKQLVKTGPITDDKDFKGRAKRVSELIRTTGGALEQDFLNIKNSVSTRSSNIKELIVLTKEILKAYEAPGIEKKEYQTFAALITLLLAHLNEEASILQKSLNITDKSERDLQKVLDKHKELHKDLIRFKIKPGSAGTGKMLALMLNDIASITMVAKVIKGYLKQLGLALDEYSKLDAVGLEKKVLEKSKKHKGFAETKKLLDMVKYINSYDSKKKDVIKEIKQMEKEGGDVPPSYEKKLKEEEEGRKEVLATFADHFKNVNQKILNDMDKFAKAIGVEVDVDDALNEFVIAYGQLEGLDKMKNIKAILRYTNDSESLAVREQYLKRIMLVIEQTKKIKARGNAKRHLESFTRSLQDFIDMVDTYSKEDKEGGFYGVDELKSTTFGESKTVLEYFVDIGKMKKTLDHSAEEITKSLGDFEFMLKKALVAKKDEFKSAKKEIDDKVKKDDIIGVNDLNRDKIRNEVGKYITWAYDIKGRMWNVAQALEIYLKEFNVATLTRYEDFIKLKDILDPIKIIKEGKVDPIIKLFDTKFAAHAPATDDYYTYLLKCAGGTVEQKNCIAVEGEAICQVDASFKWDDKLEAVKKAVESFPILKNVMSLFMGIGDRIGKEKTVYLRKKTAISVPQMWEYLGEFMLGTLYSMVYVGPTTRSLWKESASLSLDLGHYIPHITAANIITLGFADISTVYVGALAGPDKVNDALRRKVALELNAFSEGDVVFFSKGSSGGIILDNIQYGAYYEYTRKNIGGRVIRAFEVALTDNVANFTRTPPKPGGMKTAFPALLAAGPTNDNYIIEGVGTYYRALNAKTYTYAEVFAWGAEYFKMTDRAATTFLWPDNSPTHAVLGVGSTFGADLAAFSNKGNSIAGGGGAIAAAAFDIDNLVALSTMVFLGNYYNEQLEVFTKIRTEIADLLDPAATKLQAFVRVMNNWVASTRKDRQTGNAIKIVLDALVASIAVGGGDGPADLIAALTDADKLTDLTTLRDLIENGLTTLAYKARYLNMIEGLLTDMYKQYKAIIDSDDSTNKKKKAKKAAQRQSNTIAKILASLGLPYIRYEADGRAINFPAGTAPSAGERAKILSSCIIYQVNAATNAALAPQCIRLNAARGRPYLGGADVDVEDLIPSMHEAKAPTDGTAPWFASNAMSGLFILPPVNLADAATAKNKSGSNYNMARVDGTNSENMIFLITHHKGETTYHLLAKHAHDAVILTVNGNPATKSLLSDRAAKTLLTAATTPVPAWGAVSVSDAINAVNGRATPTGGTVTAAGGVTVLDHDIELVLSALKNNYFLSLFLNKATLLKEADPLAPGKKYELRRTFDYTEIQTGDSTTPVQTLVSFEPEHALFKNCIKAILAKVQVAIGVFNMFNIPGRIHTFGPERLIIGGSTGIKTVEEAIPLYVRLPLFVESYKYIFLNSSDIKNGTVSQDNDVLITFLPEMKGTVYEGLFNLIWRKMNDEDFYSDSDCIKVVGECNRIYTRFNGDNLVERVIKDLVDQVNSRYGKIKAIDIQAYSKLVEKEDSAFDESENVQAILPGEGELEFPGAQLVYDMSMNATTLGDDFYKMDKTKSIVYDFMNKFNGFFEDARGALTGNSYPRPSFNRHIESVTNRYRQCKDDRERLDVIIKAIRGANENHNADSNVSLFIHELIKTPLTLLYHIHTFIASTIKRLKPFSIGDAWREVFTLNTNGTTADVVRVFKKLAEEQVFRSRDGTMFSAYPILAAAGGPIAPNGSGYLLEFLHGNQHRFVNQKFLADPAFVDPARTHWTNYMTNLVGSDEEKARAWIGTIDWAGTYGNILDIAIALSNKDLISIKQDSGYINLDFSYLKSLVEELLLGVKELMDQARKYSINAIKELEDITNPGSYFWLKKNLYEGVLCGKHKDIPSLERLRKYIKEGFDIINGDYAPGGVGATEKIDIYQLLTYRATLCPQLALPLKTHASFTMDTLSKIIEVEKPATPDTNIGNGTGMRVLWAYNTTSLINNPSCMINFNDVLYHYLSDIYDVSLSKVYYKLLYSLSSNPIIGANLGNVSYNDAADVNKPGFKGHMLAGSDYTNNIMLRTNLYALKALITHKTKNKPTFLLSEYKDLSDPYKDRLKCCLPMYKELFGHIITKADTLGYAIPPSTNVALLIEIGFGRGRYWDWSISGRELSSLFNTAGGGTHQFLYAAPGANDTWSKIADDIFGTDKLGGAIVTPTTNLFIAGTTDLQNAAYNNLKNFLKVRLANGTLIARLSNSNNDYKSGVEHNSAFGTMPAGRVKYTSNPVTKADREDPATWIIFKHAAGGPNFEISEIYVTEAFLKAKSNIKTRFFKIVGNILGRDRVNPGAEHNGAYTAAGITPTPSQYYRPLMDNIDNIKNICSGIISDITDVSKELDDIPIHGQVSPKFIENYKDQNGVSPFMPYSTVSWYCSNTNTHSPLYRRFSLYGSDDFKLAFANRALRGSMNLKKFDLDYFPSTLTTVKDYEAAIRGKVETKLLTKVLHNASWMGKYAYYLPMNSSISNISYTSADMNILNPVDGKDYSLGTKELTLSIRETVNLMESIRIDDQKLLLITSTNSKATKRTKACLTNILDLNISPINVYALYRQVPFCGLYMYAFNGDIMTMDVLGFKLSKDSWHHLNIKKINSPSSLVLDAVKKADTMHNGNPNIVEADLAQQVIYNILIGDKKVNITEPQYYTFISSIFENDLMGTKVGKDSPIKHDHLKFITEELIGKMFLNTFTKGATKAKDQISIGPSKKLALAGTRAGANNPIVDKDGNSINTGALRTIGGVDLSPAGSAGLFLVTEGLARLNNQSIQHIVFLEIMQEVCRYFLLQSMNQPSYAVDPQILKSTQILLDYLGISVEAP